MWPNNPLLVELIMQAERESGLARYEHLRRHNLLPTAAVDGGMRAWVAARLAVLALRLDRPAAQGALQL
jgi:hypothetical protein